tara:strand:+ start:2516 stop:2800 length:285 start_codon:yes stop_codon:yes gene_type:complete
MEKIIANIAKIHKINLDQRIESKTINHINNSPSHIKMVFKTLLFANQFIYLILKVFGVDKIKFTKFIFYKRPPFLFLIYRLILSLLILSSFEEK